LKNPKWIPIFRKVVPIDWTIPIQVLSVSMIGYPARILPPRMMSEENDHIPIPKKETEVWEVLIFH